MPTCPPSYHCNLSWVATPAVPDQGDWSMLLISLVAITLIITVGCLIAMVIMTWADTHQEMSFKVK